MAALLVRFSGFVEAFNFSWSVSTGRRQEILTSGEKLL
jgi:hypothetical protein